MRRNAIWAATVAVALWSGLARAEEQPAYTPRLDADGYEVLFDGKDLLAWQMAGQQEVWGITAQGELTPLKGGGSLFSRQRYCDYVLELDFRMAGQRKCNSGVFLRDHSTADPVNTGLEIQILDNADYGVGWDAMNANGALYDLVHPTVDANKPLGEWNHYKITANDARLTVELNGKTIVEADLAKWTEANKNPDGSHNKFPHAIGTLPREGFLGLQNYGGVPVWFKQVRLKPLSDRKPKYTGAEPIADVLGQPAK